MAASASPKSQIYDSIASDYDIIWKIPAVKILMPLLTTTLHSLGPWDGKAVMDLACGTGIGLRLLKSLGATNLVGVDISTEMLEVCKMTSPNEFELHRADCSKPLDDLGLDKGSFDLVLAMWLLNYAPSREDMKGMWENIATYLKPGGKFVGILQNHDTVHPACMRDKMEEYGARETDFEELGNGDGWKGHVEFDTQPKVEFDCFVLKGSVVEGTAQEAGMKGLRYVRAGEEVKAFVEGKSDKWWRELLDEYPNQVIVAEKA